MPRHASPLAPRDLENLPEGLDKNMGTPPHNSWPLGLGFAFVSKATRELWQAAPGEVLDKIDAMVPVPPKSMP